MKNLISLITCVRRRFPVVVWGFLLSLLLTCGWGLWQNRQSMPETVVISPLPQDPAVQVYFNHNLAAKYEDPYRHFIRKGDNLEEQIITAINQAQYSINIAVMEFRLPKVAEALIAKQKSGVKVRLIIDNQYNKTLDDYPSNATEGMNKHNKSALEELRRYPADALAILRKNGIEIKDDSSDGATKGSGLMHHKFVVIDGKTTIISSGNFTTSDLHGDFNASESRGNPNNMVVVNNNPQVAQVFDNEFNYMWQGLFKIHKPYRPPATISVGAGTITINFSPARKNQDIEATSNGIISFFIKQAKKSVHIALFVFSDQTISDNIAAIHDQGVGDIKMLIDPDFYGQSYSKAYDALGLCPSTRKKIGKINVHPWAHPIQTVGFPTSPPGDRGVHSKMAILDGRMAIAGSHNWSKAANYSNDETLIAIDNPTVAAHYEREFERLYATAVLGVKSLPHAQQCGGNSLNNALPSVKPESDNFDAQED